MFAFVSVHQLAEDDCCPHGDSTITIISAYLWV